MCPGALHPFPRGSPAAAAENTRAKCLSTNSRLHSVRRWTAVASWEPCGPTCNRRSSLQSTRRCKGQQPCLPAGHVTQHATDPAGRRTPRAVLREHDDERADPRISGGDYCRVRLMVCFSPDCCTCRWQFNQYRHTLSVFLSGVRAADSGIAGVGGHGGAGGAVEEAVVGLCCVAPSPAQPVPLTPALWSDSPEPSASLIGSQSRVNQRSVSAGSISRNRCSSHHFRPPGMEPPTRAATCVLPQLPLCCCDSPATHERTVARRPLLYSLLEPSTRGAPDAQPPQAAQKGASQGFRADGTAAMRTDAGAASRGFDPAPFCFTTESQ